MKKNPYRIIRNKHVTEKSVMLEGLKDSDSNRSSRAFKNPKYVFIVDKSANKTEIAEALEEIYKELEVSVVSVNTILVKPKKRRVRGKIGFTPSFKKAIVTFKENDILESV